METRTQDPTAPGAQPAPGESHRPGPEAGGRVTDDQTPGHAFNAAKQSVAQLLDYISYYFSARTDAMKASARSAAMYAVLGVVGLIAAAALIVTAVALLCIGLAQAISTLFGTGPWLGNLVTAVLLLAGVAGVVMIGMKGLTGQSRERTVKKYAARQQQQRAKYGQDVSQARGPVE